MIPPPDKKAKKKHKDPNILVRVLACSLSPGDCRMIGGHKDLFCTPEKLGTTWPYVPGLDVCGEVVELDPNDTSGKFKVGDKIIGTWDTVGMGGMAEYALVKSSFAAVLPEDAGLSAVEGAAAANSASHAFGVLERAKIKKGDRVMILGGGGGGG